MAKLRSTREIVVWSEVVEVLQRRLAKAMESLDGADDMRAIGKAQGRIAVLQEMLTLPAAMVSADEMDAAAEENTKQIRMSQDPKNWKLEVSSRDFSIGR
jgi:hypothetical protein